MRSNSALLTTLVTLAAAICLVAGAACGANDGEKGRDTGTAANETVPGEIEAAGRKLLAGELEADEGDFRLEGSESVQWSDTSLGCPQEGMMYAQVITPGYKLVFDIAGASYAVHTNSDGSNVVVCGDGR